MAASLLPDKLLVLRDFRSGGRRRRHGQLLAWAKAGLTEQRALVMVERRMLGVPAAPLPKQPQPELPPEPELGPEDSLELSDPDPVSDQE